MKNGVILAIFSSLIFSVMNALVKAISPAIPAAEIMFFRSFIGAVAIYFLMRKQRIPFSAEGVPLLMLRGMLGAIYLFAYFYTISKIPLADASILAHLSPMFAILLSWIVLKEKVGMRTLYILPLVVAGAVILLKPWNFSSYSVHAFAGIISALFAGGAAVSIRHLSKRHHSYEIVFYFLAAGTLVSVPLMWNRLVIPTAAEFGVLLCIAAVSLLGQIYLTKAFTHERVVVVEITRYIGIVFNAIWGFLFWFEVPDAATLAGGVLIIVSCIYLSRPSPAKETSKINPEKLTV